MTTSKDRLLRSQLLLLLLSHAPRALRAQDEPLFDELTNTVQLLVNAQNSF